MKILVTGGSGFIGSHLVKTLLDQGHIVWNIDNFDDFYDYRVKINNTLRSVGKAPCQDFFSKEKDIQTLADSFPENSNYRLIYRDICDPLEDLFSALSPDLVIHLAALAGVRPSLERPLEYERVNIRGTQNIWEHGKNFGIKKFIIASSSSVYGEHPEPPFSENLPVDKPISPYAATKKAGEIIGHVYHHLYGMDMIHLRFFTVYGPGQRPDLAIHKFAKKISLGEPIPFYGSGETYRDYTYIDDIISGIHGAIQLVMKKDKVYECINLGESQTISLQTMVQTLEEELGKKAILSRLPVPPGDVPATYADITKAKELLGYRPTTDFQNGIKKFVEWFLSQGMHTPKN